MKNSVARFGHYLVLSRDVLLGAIAIVVCFTQRILKNLCESLVMIGYTIYDEARDKPLKALLFVLLVAFLFVARSNRAETFPLNKAIPDKTLVCRNADAAIAIAESIITYPAMAQAIYVNLMNNGICFNIEGMMTYHKLVHTTNKKWYVYEMDFGGTVGYVPTSMKSDGIDI